MTKPDRDIFVTTRWTRVQRNHCFQAPNVIGYARFHRGGNAKALADSKSPEGTPPCPKQLSQMGNPC